MPPGLNHEPFRRLQLWEAQASPCPQRVMLLVVSSRMIKSVWTPQFCPTPLLPPLAVIKWSFIGFELMNEWWCWEISWANEWPIVSSLLDWSADCLVTSSYPFFTVVFYNFSFLSLSLLTYSFIFSIRRMGLQWNLSFKLLFSFDLKNQRANVLRRKINLALHFLK